MVCSTLAVYLIMMKILNTNSHFIILMSSQSIQESIIGFLYKLSVFLYIKNVCAIHFRYRNVKSSKI